MTARRSPALLSRLVWLILLVGVLSARGLTPEGWMPVANASGGIAITVCNGNGPGDAMVLTSDGKLHHNAPAKGQTGDHPCAFAGLGIADAAPPPPVMMPMAPATVIPALAKRAMLPGRGLAAPPPPATGPPAHA